jgi:putative aminophosphonate oxidoreductase
LEGEIRADVCIVGGGYTGLWTAIRLKERDPSVDVAVIEADVCGGGASGRNGGFVLSWWAKFETLAKIAGTEEALHLARASSDAVSAIGKFCADHGIDARYRGDGWLWAATNQAQVGAWRETADALARAGERPFVELSPDDVAARSGSRRHVAGVFEPTGAIVQPALLARGLRRVALEQGVRLFERSPMTALQRRPLRVGTPKGTIRAQRVVLAMNAWAVRFAEIRRRILVIGSDIVATDPVPERLREIGWTDGMSISDSRLLVHYYRTTDDGRIVFGKGGGRLAFGALVPGRFDGASPRAAEVAAALRSVYPSLGGVRVVADWTGPIDRSRTGLPYFAPLSGRPDVVYGIGYSGNGVGPSFIGGKILASLALGADDEWSRCALVGRAARGFPPEPFRYLGGSLVRAAIARKERAEDEGKRPNPIDLRLIRLAPPGLTPMHED